MRRSRKPLSVVRRIEGSNPSPSARLDRRSARDAARALSREQMSELRSGADVELAIDVSEVVLDRLRAKEESRSDVAVRVAFADRERHLQLLRGQPLGGRGVAAASGFS